MHTDASMVDYYARRASEYEGIYHRTERQGDLESLRQHIRSTFAGADVLEIACGTGYWTRSLAETAKSVLATDINQEVLEIARRKEMDPATVSFQPMNAYDLTAFGRRFNGMLAAFWWSHMPKSEIRRFLEGLRQVLSPGARLVFLDNVYVEGNSTPISRMDQEGNTYQLRRLEEGSIHEVRKNFPTSAELGAAVEGVASAVRIEFLRHYWFLDCVISQDAQ